MFRAAALCLSLLISPLAAQSWQGSTFDNNSWFTGFAFEETSQTRIYCGGTSAGGIPLPQSDEPTTTNPYTMALILGMPALGGEGAFVGGRDDLMLVVGPNGYRLPRSDYDLVREWGWFVLLGIDDPLFAAMAQNGDQPIAVYSGQNLAGQLPGTGLAAALTEVTQFCRTNWQATGFVAPVSGGANPAPATPEARAQAAVAQTCGGQSQARPGTYRAVEVNNDAVPDILLDWTHVTCQAGQFPNARGGGNCGFDACLIELFASGPSAAAGSDFALIAMAAQPDTTRPDQLVFSLRPAACTARGAPAGCGLRMRWDGTTMVEAN